MSSSDIHIQDHHAHSHDHDHDHEHHELPWIRKYIFSEDHKVIAKQYLISGILWAILGGMFSLVFRIQLGFPNADLSWMKPALGEWIQNGKLDPEFYLAMVTMHGTIMVFFVLTAGLSGTFSNFLIPLQIGARDMASGFLNMLSYWFFFLSSVVMFSSVFISTGPASGGWVIYPPLSALPQAMSGSGLGIHRLYITWGLELRNDYSQFENKRNDFRSSSSYDLGFYDYRNYRYLIFPCIVLGCIASHL
jgi:cytochrome c oxidase subunit 1